MGYKPEQFVEKVDENLICAICREVLKDPWGCKDGHTFCKDCIKQCLMTHQRCPMDNRALQVNDLVPNLIAKNMVANLNVFCHPSKNDGQDGEPEQCEWKGKLQHLEKHQETCPFYPVRCPNAKCNTWMQRRGMKYHVKICKYAVVMCMKCRKALIRYVLEHHIAHECPETLIDCPNKCLNQQQQINQIKRGDLKNHRTNICVKRMVDCPFKDQGCSVQVVQQDVDMHVQQNMAEHMMLLAKENKILKEEVNQLKLLFEVPKPFDSMMGVTKGETWHRIRTTLTPTFSAHKMKLMIPLMNKSCDLLEKKLDQVAGTGETIDIYKYYQGLTMEAILATFFGIESNAQNDYNDPAFKAGRESLDPGTVRRALTSAVAIIPFGTYLIRYFPSFFIGQFQNLVYLSEKIIEARRQEGSSQRKDVLDLMISNTKDEKKGLTETEMIAQSMAFLIAGYETTSMTLTMVCHCLIANPDVQEKLQREIDEVWSDEDEPPSYEVVQSLPYLDMVISETLRLYPPVPLTTRECTKDCVIKGLHFKTGTPVITAFYSMHHDPEFFPDPEKFDPERFTAEAKASRDPYTYLPFGHGPRNCIGMRFAQMEMKLALVRVLKRFNLVVAPETKIPPVIKARTALGCDEDGIKLRVKRRGELTHTNVKNLSDWIRER